MPSRLHVPQALGQATSELVGLADQFPAALRDVSFEKIAADSLSDLGGPQVAGERMALIDEFLASTENFQRFNLARFRKGGPEPEPGAAYESAREVANLVRWIADDNSKPFLFAERFQVPGLPIYITHAPRGRLTFRQSPLQPLYDELRKTLQTLDASRFRFCRACARVFWAYRKDQAACSRPCANRTRVRRWYSEHAQKVKKDKRDERKARSKSGKRKS